MVASLFRRLLVMNLHLHLFKLFKLAQDEVDTLLLVLLAVLDGVYLVVQYFKFLRTVRAQFGSLRVLSLG